MFPKYQIYVLNWAGQIVKFYDGAAFYSLKYSRELNSIGSIALALPTFPGIGSIFKLDHFIEVQRTSPKTGKLLTEETYFVRMVNMYQDGDEERFIVGGQSLNHLIGRRVVDPDDDPLQAGGYSTKAGAADQLMHDYATDQMSSLASVSRRFPNFFVGGAAPIGKPVGQRLRHENLLKIFEALAAQGQVDFYIKRLIGNTLELQFGILGVDMTRSYNYPFTPSVILTPRRGNLTNPSLKLDRTSEENFVYIKGQGQGDKRLVYKLPSDTIFDSPYNRNEFAEDGRSSTKSNALELYTQGKSALTTKRKVKQFTFNPGPDEPGNTYRFDWDLGDYLTIIWDDFELNFRVIGIEISVNAGGEDIKVTMGQPNV